MREEDIINLIRSDAWMMSVLRAARSLRLPDWMLGAGFVRNKVWDELHGYKHKEVPTADIDLIYYDADDVDEKTEKEYDEVLKKAFTANWSAKNQARMHVHKGRTKPYKDTEEALADWVETPTAVAVRLEDDDTLTLFAPYGVDDLVNLIVRPTPTDFNRKDNFETYRERIRSKGWKRRWPKLTMIGR